ncbi:MAG: hypothetical protein MJ236_02420 [Clostridia bacterium]|nr:hypothetical protein [Clostridia bacterium]
MSDVKTHNVRDLYSFLTLGFTFPSIFRLGFVNCIVGMLSVFIPLFIVAFIKPYSIGGADIKLGSALALGVGFPNAVFGLTIGLVFGVLVTLIKNRVKRKDSKEPFALIPYLAIGFFSFFLLSVIGG